ncbi:MAG: cation:proton antiporter [Candidatus Desulfofervidus auxilii]|nr:cation:proton antiporter [Candidatus Desulfofervidus auxilii]
MHLNQAFSLMIITIGAALLPNISYRLKLPPVVAEILFGVLIGKTFLNVTFSGEWLPFLANLGFLMLMFLAGVEINFSMLEKQKPRQLLLYGVIFIATLTLAYIFSLSMGQGLFLALILSTTSLGLVVPTLHDVGISKAPLGQSILISATLADFLTFFGITFYLLFQKHGFSWQFIIPVPLFIFFGLLLWIARLWFWWNPEKAASLLGKSGPSELGVRFSMALLFIFVALSRVVGLDPLLGAFMGGCLLSFIFREKRLLEEKLTALAYGFLIPFFFIYVGIQFELKNILDKNQLLLIAKILLAAFVIKIIPSLLLVINKFPWKCALKAGILLSARLSLIVAAASIGVQQGFITPHLKDSIILLAIITSTLAPTIFKQIFNHETKLEM